VGRRVEGDGTLGFQPGRGRPWERVARGHLRSKVKSSEWSKFGGERLLGAANGDEARRRIHGIKKQSREGEDCAARGKEVIFCQKGKVRNRTLEKESKGCGTLRDLRATISVTGDSSKPLPHAPFVRSLFTPERPSVRRRIHAIEKQSARRRRLRPIKASGMRTARSGREEFRNRKAIPLTACVLITLAREVGSKPEPFQKQRARHPTSFARYDFPVTRGPPILTATRPPSARDPLG